MTIVSAEGEQSHAAQRHLPRLLPSHLGLTGVKMYLNHQNQEQLAGSLPLHSAAAAGNVSLVDELLSHNKADLQERDPDGRTALHLAALAGHIGVVRRLCESGVEVDARDGEGRTALHVVARESHVDVAQVLLESGASPNTKARNGMMPLHIAAVAQDCALDMLRPVPDHPPFTTPTLAQIAAINNHFQGMPVAVTPILGKGLGVVAQTPIEAHMLVAYYVTSIYPAGHHRPSNYAIRSPLDAGTGDGAARFYDINEGSFQPPGADGIPEIGPYVNELSEDEPQSNNLVPVLIGDNHERNRTIHGLFTQRAVAVGEELVYSYGRGYGRRGYRAKPPPGENFCTAGDNVRVARLLIDRGADVGGHVGLQVDAKGFTALHLAAKTDDAHMVRELVREAGGEVDAVVGINGQTALHVAAIYDSTNAVIELLHLDAAPDITNNEGVSALHLAASKGHAEVVRALVEGGAFIDMRLQERLTPLHLAASKGHVQTVKVLLESGAADLEVVGVYGVKALHLAESRGHTEVVNLLRLLEHGKFSREVVAY